MSYAGHGRPPAPDGYGGAMADHVEGVSLARTEENRAAIDALAALCAGRAGLAGVLADLHRRGRRGWAPGLAARRAFTWDAVDRRTTRWWPQGITTSADADPSGRVHGRELVLASWYAKPGPHGHQGSRVSVVDLATRRYRHVLLVVPSLDAAGQVQVSPLRVHAGGIVWNGRYLHVAATARGLVTCDLDDIVRVPDGAPLETFGYRYVLPVRFAYEGVTDEGHERLRYSFLSLDRQSTPPHLLAGEYALGDRSRRLARYALERDGLLETDDDGTARPLGLDEGVHQTQGAVAAHGRYHLTVSHGPWVPGSVAVGRPGAFVMHRWATPMGPEDVSYWPDTDQLWSLSEHPRRRWVFAMDRARFSG